MNLIMFKSPKSIDRIFTKWRIFKVFSAEFHKNGLLNGFFTKVGSLILIPMKYSDFPYSTKINWIMGISIGRIETDYDNHL